MSNAGAVFAHTDRLGIYGVGTGSQAGGAKFSGYFAVNLFDKLESAIKPAAALTVGRAQIAPSVRDQVGQREFWPYVAALALAILLIEWWVYHRGSRVGGPHAPSRPGRRGLFSPQNARKGPDG